MKCILNLKELFSRLESNEYIKYVLIKTDVPYMPFNFPKEYAVGKDLDIMIPWGGLDEARTLFEEYAEEYAEEFDIYCIDETHGFRVRFQEGKKLHFQFDVKCASDNMPNDFIYKLINNGTIYIDDEYPITTPEYEIIFRIENQSPHKPHHQKYIEDHLDVLDASIIPDKLKNKTISILKDIVCKTKTK
jgi:hypothetical protein